MASPFVMLTLVFGLALGQAEARTRPQTMSEAEATQAILSTFPEEVRRAIALQDAREMTRTARPYVERCVPGVEEPVRCLALLGMLSMTLVAVRDHDAARGMTRRALAIAVAAQDPVEIAGVRWVAAKVEYAAGNFEEAERGFREALDMYAALGRATQTIRWRIELERVQLLLSLQRFGEAESAAKAVIAAASGPTLIEFRVLGKIQLALTWMAALRYTDSIAAYREVIAEIEQAGGADHPALTGVLNDLAMVLTIAKRDAEAIEMIERADRIAQTHFTPTNQVRQMIAANRGALLARLGRCAEAEPVLRPAYAALLDQRGWVGAVASLALARCLKHTPGKEGEAMAHIAASMAFPLDRLKRSAGFSPETAREFTNYSEIFREKVAVNWTIAGR
jgi:tetratricopeptide (TPR) repeat protein